MDYYFSVGNIKCKINDCIDKDGISVLDNFRIEPCKNVDINYYVHNFNYDLLDKFSSEKPISSLERILFYKFENKFFSLIRMPGERIAFSSIDIAVKDKIDIYIDKEKWHDFALFSQMFFEVALLKFAGFFLHSSVVSTKYGGIVFSAPSQTGKSTQASLWEKYEDADVINGDKGIYRRFNDGWRVYGGPWAGTSGIYHNECINLKAAFIISQGKSNSIVRLSPLRAFSSIISEAFLPYWDKDLADEGMKIVEMFVKEVPVYAFECTPDENAVTAVKELLLTL